MRLLSAVALGALVAGCTAPHYQRVSGPVPIVRGTAADFAALVPRSTGAARCEVRERDAGTPGRVIALVRDEPVEQRISVLLDADGNPVRYLDVRGEDSQVGGASGDRTTIGLYLTEGYAIAGNRTSGREQEVFEIPLEEATTSPNLGKPGEMLEQVLTQCR